MKRNLLTLFLALFVAFAANAQTYYSVTFNCDMNDSIASGYFVPSTDALSVMGDLAGWATPGSVDTLFMTDGDNDGIYTLTVDLTAGNYAYKYFKNNGWDNGEWNGDPNRTFGVYDAAVVLNDVYGLFVPSTETDIIAFSFTEQTGAATIDADAHTVNIEVGYGTDVTALVSTFTLSAGATANIDGTNQVSETTANDFTSAVTYNVVAEDGTTSQDWTVTVTVAASSGVNDISNAVSIYPNPSNGVFNINVENNYNLEVFDITGRIINTRTLTGNTSIKLDNAGVYFLRFSNEKGSFTQKVIVQ